MASYERPPYYLTAYGLALRQGFSGTLQEWLDSLKGEKGDSVKLRVSQGKLQWKAISAAQVGDEEIGWEDIIDLSTIEPTDINDTATASNSTWSSSKISKEIEAMLTYEPIKFTALTATPSVAEIGSTLEQVILEWKLSKKPESLTLNGSPMEAVQVGSYTFNIAGGTQTDITFEMEADDGVKKVQSRAIVPFCNGVYYGVGPIPETIDSAFIIGLGNKVLRKTKLSQFTETAGEGEYIYYCLPVGYGECSFVDVDSGFVGGIQKIGTVTGFLNSSGNSDDDYNVYRSDFPNLGKMTFAVL